MKSYNQRSKAHLFICTRQKEQGKQCCALKNASVLRAELKEWCQEYAPDVQVTAAQCLGKCSEGIAAILYPQAQWITELELKDKEKIQDLLSKLVS